MSPDNESLSNAPNAFRLSKLWDIYIPITIATVPAAIFKLLGLITRGLDNPGAQPSTLLIVAMIAVQTLGIIAMAFVILIRFEFGLQQLSILTNGHPPIWRKLVLLTSIVCILLFDLLTNVAAAFAGAGPLLVGAFPAFVAYLLCIRIAFAKL